MIPPPWNVSALFTEEGLRAAQEYYFRTHATHARMVAEGRAAQGLSKSFVRRKLEREMGEDFRMYTGQAIGQALGQAESQGIRGELNALLEHIYRSIASNQPITSPIQEDLTILGHPHGALEVCYAMVFYYTSLLKSYASLASNKRQVLKSLLDEELFKWVWRMVIAYLLSNEETRLFTGDSYLSVGLRSVPRERQQATMAQKLHEVGMFLLSKTLHESHLRFPLCYYFVLYLRQLQANLLAHCDRHQAEEVYGLITRRDPHEPLENPLVAIDVLMNSSGSSVQSFDDILQDEERLISQFIPDDELEFIRQFDEYVDPKRIAGVLKRIIPDVRKESADEGPASLMPLVLLLRILPTASLDLVLYKLPAPMLVMVRNRIINSTVDEVGKTLLERIKEMMEVRQKRGETYGISSRTKGTVQMQSAPAQGAPAQPAAQAAGQARPAGGAEPAAAASQPAGNGGVLNQRLILAWRPEPHRVAVISLSAAELLDAVGADARLVVPFVVLAVKTGQVFGVTPDKVAKEDVQRMVGQLVSSLPEGHVARLGEAERSRIVQTTRGASPAKVLQAVLKAAHAGPAARQAGTLAEPLQNVAAKLDDQLADFLRRPGHDDFREVRAMLTPAERQAVVVLQKVARAQ